MDPYTDLTLAQWMERRMGELAGILGMTAQSGSFEDMVNDVKFSLNEEDLSSFTTLPDIKKVRVMAEVSLWQGVVSATAGQYTFSADGGTFTRAEIQAMALKNLELAKAEGLAYDPAWSIVTQSVTYGNDFYMDHDDDLYA